MIVEELNKKFNLTLTVSKKCSRMINDSRLETKDFQELYSLILASKKYYFISKLEESINVIKNKKYFMSQRNTRIDTYSKRVDIFG